MKKDLYYVLWQEPEGWAIKCLHTGVTTCGDTKKEAIEMLKEAVSLYYETETDVLIPEKTDFGKVALYA